MKIIFWISIFCFVVDFVSKQMVVHFLQVGESFSVIGDFLAFSSVRNTGIAFSLLEGNLVFIILMTLVIIGLIFYIMKEGVSKKKEQFGYGMILGGAFGNLFDRIVYGYVVDFFDFCFGSYHFAIFNVADMWIVMGTLLLLWSYFMESRGKHGNHSEANGAY